VLQQSERVTSPDFTAFRSLFLSSNSPCLFAPNNYNTSASDVPLACVMQLKKKKQLPVVLSIAGYDPSSGAGITADIKTIAAHGCYGVTCITALTVQSTRGVKRVDPVEGRIISETLELLIDDMDIAAVKIGMLGSVEAAKSVAAFLRRHALRCVVLDPVLRSSSGTELISPEGLKVLRERILPQAFVVTPNIDEAATLCGLRVTNVKEMESAARLLQAAGARTVIVTGGHLDPPHDLVVGEGGQVTIVKGRKVSGHSTHGTGCAFSTALACNLAQGKPMLDAARLAKHYVASALKQTPGIGKGVGPVV
jgi:hydroxymethylpyrimidine/phosphomethylpyrimidine kinase